MFLKTDKETDGYNWSKKPTSQTIYKEDILHIHAEIRNFFFSLKRTSEIFSITQREYSYLQAAMYCSIFYTNTNEIPNYFALISFGRERCGLLCSHGNGDLYKSEDQYQVFAQKLTWYFISGYVIIHILLLSIFKHSDVKTIPIDAQKFHNSFFENHILLDKTKPYSNQIGINLYKN